MTQETDMDQAERIAAQLALFDRVAAHLLAQRRRAARGMECRYRTHDGLKCAVGCLIDDAHYSVELEGLDVRNKRVLPALAASGVPLDGATLALLADLQAVHDGRDPAAWPDILPRMRPYVERGGYINSGRMSLAAWREAMTA